MNAHSKKDDLDDPDVHYNVGWVDGLEAAAKLAEDDPYIVEPDRQLLARRIRELKRIAEEH